MRVLLATDGSIEAELAEAVLTKLPLAEPSISVATVIAHPSIALMPPGLPYEFDDGTLTRLQDEVAGRTTAFIVERLAKQGYCATAHIAHGDPASQLLDIAKSGGIDLIAVGSRIESSVRAAFLGSVSRKLSLYSGCSVLVGHHYRQRPASGSIEKLQMKDKLDVLVAVDGSAGCLPVIQAFSQLRSPRFGSISVVSVCAEPLGKASDSESRALQFAKNGARALAGCADEVQPYVRAGRPSKEISRFAEEHSIDLIVLGANQHGLLERVLVGSCAYETITHAPCSVLLIRNGFSFD